jgi:hypothetical protein
MSELSLLIGVALDTIVLFYTAGFLKVRGNSFPKALLVTLASLGLGYVLGIAFLASLFVSLGLTLLIALAAVLLRLFLIKFFYRTGFGKAFAVWIVSALVSIAVQIFLPV